MFPDAGLHQGTTFEKKCSAWFDTFSLDDLGDRQDLQVPGLRDSIQLVKSVVENEVDVLNGHVDRVVLGGFSQDSAVALWSILSGAGLSKGHLGGFLGLSAWMPFAKTVNCVE